jgi:hypothetical protein
MTQSQIEDFDFTGVHKEAEIGIEQALFAKGGLVAAKRFQVLLAGPGTGTGIYPVDTTDGPNLFYNSGWPLHNLAARRAVR